MKPPSILVVEDNPITRKMLRFALQSEGYSVRDAGDGATALDLAARERPDLVVTDSVLPDTDGLHLLDALRRGPGGNDLRALMITGMVSRIDAIRAQAGDDVTVLPKPVEPSRLLEVVRTHLARKTAGEGRGRRVLVVDDELLNRKLAALRLRDAGFVVETAGGGEEALTKALASPPDAVLSDILMPGMDGFLLCRSLRQEPATAHIPVVLFSSAYVDEADRSLAREMGASALVPRTPDLGDAIDAVSTALKIGTAPASRAREDQDVRHKERLEVQLQRQIARNETLLREAAIQAAALSVVRGLSEALTHPSDLPGMLGDCLVHALDAAGLSTGLLYLTESEGGFRLAAQAGLPFASLEGARDCFGHGEVLERSLAAGQLVTLTQGDADRPDEPARELLSRLGTASALVVPFVVKGRKHGALLLASDSHDLGGAGWTSFGATLGAQFGETIAFSEALARLTRSEQRLRCLSEADIIGISVADLDGRVIEANDHYIKMLGLTAEDIAAGRARWDELTPPEWRARDEIAVQELTNTGRASPWEKELLRKDGTRVPVQLGVALLEGREVIAFIQDISARKQAEQGLRESEERYRVLFDSNPLPMWVFDLDTLAFLEANAAAVRQYGYAREEFLRLTIKDIRGPEDVPALMRGLADVAAAGGSVEAFPARHIKKDGTPIDVEITGRDSAFAGRRARLVAMRDVTERKRAEAERARLTRAVEQAVESIVITDPEGSILYVNPAFERMSGYGRDEVLGKSPRVLKSGRHDAAFYRELWATLLEGRVWQGRLVNRRKDGALYEEEATISPVRDPSGQVVNYVSVQRDLTQEKRLEAQLRQAQKMEAVGRLAGGVAHDFNNLLGVITGYGELLRRRVAGDERLARYADDILKAAHRAAGLTRQLLAFSRKQILQARVLDLNAVVEEMDKMLRRLIGEDIQLVSVFDHALGTVMADPGQIEQILMNLAVNSRDAMPRGGRLTIETGNVDLDSDYARNHAGVPPGRYALLAVSDTGHGMSPEVQAHIFEPFFTTKTEGKGTGLGLATVHGIVKQSGGHIFVYSEPGKGTTFKVYLPRIEKAEEAREAAAALSPQPRGSETVLLAEDEAGLRVLVRECLEACGYTVLEARRGDEALAIAEGHEGPIHLLITDVIMPVLSGREVSERLAATRPDMRVLYMSGYTDDAVVRHGILVEGVPFLQKPFSPDALARKVRDVLDVPRAASGVR